VFAPHGGVTVHWLLKVDRKNRISTFKVFQLLMSQPDIAVCLPKWKTNSNKCASQQAGRACVRIEDRCSDKLHPLPHKGQIYELTQSW